LKEALILLVIPEYSRHPWRSRCAPPSAFAFAILQTQSRSDIRNPVPFCSNSLRQRHWVPAFAGMTTMWVDQAFPWPEATAFLPLLERIHARGSSGSSPSAQLEERKRLAHLIPRVIAQQ
jgi:hypothetical protein